MKHYVLSVAVLLYFYIPWQDDACLNQHQVMCSAVLTFQLLYDLRRPLLYLQSLFNRNSLPWYVIVNAIL